MTLLPAHGRNTVEILINDHNVIKSLLTGLTQGDRSQRQATLEQLKGVLTIHNATEENLVYPALDKVAEEGREAAKLYHETAEADILVFELDNALRDGDDATFEATAKKFVKAVRAHIDDEESKAFPHLVEGSDRRESEALTASVKTFREKLRFEAGRV